MLAQAPQHPDARRIRDAARNGALADALARGSRALQDGATSSAIQAAGEALALDPESAEARRILAGVQISSTDADAARARMAEGRSAAEATGAATRAASALESRGSCAARCRPVVQVPRISPPPPPATTRRADYIRPRRPRRGPRRRRRSSRRGPDPRRPRRPKHLRPRRRSRGSGCRGTAAGDSIAPSPWIRLPPVLPNPRRRRQLPPPAIVNPPPADEAAQPAGAEDRIIDLIGRYKNALESRNIDQVKRLWPSLGGAAETALRQEFEHSRQIAVGITRSPDLCLGQCRQR